MWERRGEKEREKRKNGNPGEKGKKGKRKDSRKGDDQDQRRLPDQRSERKEKEEGEFAGAKREGWGEEELVIIHVTADRAASGRDSAQLQQPPRETREAWTWRLEALWNGMDCA